MQHVALDARWLRDLNNAIVCLAKAIDLQITKHNRETFKDREKRLWEKSEKAV